MNIRMNETKFNHLSFPSTDVSRTVAFFERYMGCSVSARGTIEGKNFEWAVLKRAEFDIVIESADRALDWPFQCHLGLEMDTAAEVHALHEQFAREGVEMVIGYQGSTGQV